MSGFPGVKKIRQFRFRSENIEKVKLQFSQAYVDMLV